MAKINWQKKIENFALTYIARSDSPLAVQLGILICILALLGGLLAAAIKLLEGVSMVSGIIMASSILIAGFLYFVCLKYKQYKLGTVLCYFFGCMVCIPFTFIVGGGISSGLIAYFVLALVLAFLMFHDRTLIPIIIIEITIFLSCIAISYYYPSMIQRPSSNFILHLDNIQGVLICGLFIGGLIKFQIWLYGKEKEKADEASKAKANFLATMSHEIRTPMNAIIGFQEAILREPLSDKQKKYMENLRMSSFALLDIVNNILDFSKIDAGSMVVTNSVFNLHQLLENLAAVTEVAAKEKALEVKTNFASSLPEYIVGDESKTRQILNNILSNAIKYTLAGSITFSAKALDTELSFEIADTGIGIREEDMSRIFLPFEQLDLRKNKGIIGTGLGLAITQKLCAALGGSIELESVYGKGSVFTVTLPLIISELTKAKKAEPDEAFRAPNAKVLVVDDVDINLMVAEAMLEVYEIKPDLALSGKAALEKAASTEYDLIFMDQMMPGMDGIETTARLRQINDHYARLPIVALTANVMNTSGEYFKGLGFSAFLSKPIEAEKLTKCLQDCLPAERV
ncbi:hypothetical protein AGMMS49928_21720 [Spirochaetia bacterium]|nr:hypothetical protein AGMMS49928_21720 [Spirochaetia bacterium]